MFENELIGSHLGFYTELVTVVLVLPFSHPFHPILSSDHIRIRLNFDDQKVINTSKQREIKVVSYIDRFLPKRLEARSLIITR